MIFNIIYGKAAFATINASTQYSSSFTCSDGTITLSASGTSVSFVVPKSGTWTVTCTYGGTTKSNTVNVTTYGGTYSTSFTFIKYLYHDGVQDVAWKALNTGTDRVTFTSSYMQIYGTSALTNSTVDLSGYSTLTVQFTQTSDSTINYSRMGYANPPSGVSWSFEKQVSLTNAGSKTTASLDVSSVNSSKAIGFMVQSDATLRVYQVYLTP